MEKRHIAVFTPAVGGHVYPALAVCSELVSRGHRVTYATTERYAAKVRETGATAIEFKEPEIRNAEKIAQLSSSDDWRPWLSVVGPISIATAAVTAAESEGFYAENPPDLILYDWFAFAGRILAKQLGCPAIQMHTHFAHYHDSLMRIEGVGTTPEPLLAFATLLDSFLSTYGLEERGHLWRYEEFNIVLVPKEFQYDLDSFDSRRFKFVGATHNRKPRASAWKNRAEKGKPLVLISETTSSTDGRFLRLCIDALAESKYHVVASKAANTPEIPAESLPRNFEINRTAFNCEILPFANVMLCEGGMGTALESLYHGVPAVALPPHAFNTEVAYRLAELGLGLYVRQPGVTSNKVREAVDIASSDEAMLRRVKRTQSDLASSPDPVEAAADSIEGHLEAR